MSNKHKDSRTSRQYFISIYLFKDGETLAKYSSHQKSRVLRFLQMKDLAELKIDCGVCQVSYIPEKRVFNLFKFKDLESFRKSIDECTEPELLEFIAGGVW